MARAEAKMEHTNEAAAEATEAMRQTAEAPLDAANAAIRKFSPEAMTEQFRSFTEQGVAQSREAYAKFKAQAEENQKTLEESAETVRATVQTVSRKGIENARKQSESAFDHVEKLMGVTSLSELVELQTAFLRKQAEMNIEQIKEMQNVTTGAMEEFTKPARNAFTKAMDSRVN